MLIAFTALGAVHIKMNVELLEQVKCIFITLHHGGKLIYILNLPIHLFSTKINPVIVVYKK